MRGGGPHPLPPLPRGEGPQGGRSGAGQRLPLPCHCLCAPLSCGRGAGVRSAILFLIHARLEHANVWQVAILLRVVQAEADDEAVGDAEAGVLWLNDVFLVRLRFI